MANKEEIFDVVVIGAGQVGESAAARTVRGGLSTAVVERRLAGGGCEYYGCVPSKAMLLPLERAAEVSRMPGLSLYGPIDAPAVFARRDQFVDHHHDTSQVSLIKSYPAAFVRGQGRLAGPLRAEVIGSGRQRADLAGTACGGSPYRQRLLYP